MNQYCRYCINCVLGDAPYCSKHEKTMNESYVKRTNKCKDFDFCEIDVFDHDHKYTPRKQRQINDLEKNQITWRFE